MAVADYVSSTFTDGCRGTVTGSCIPDDTRFPSCPTLHLSIAAILSLYCFTDGVEPCTARDPGLCLRYRVRRLLAFAHRGRHGKQNAPCLFDLNHKPIVGPCWIGQFAWSSDRMTCESGNGTIAAKSVVLELMGLTPARMQSVWSVVSAAELFRIRG